MTASRDLHTDHSDVISDLCDCHQCGHTATGQWRREFGHKTRSLVARRNSFLTIHGTSVPTEDRGQQHPILVESLEKHHFPIGVVREQNASTFTARGKSRTPSENDRPSAYDFQNTQAPMTISNTRCLSGRSSKRDDPTTDVSVIDSNSRTSCTYAWFTMAVLACLRHDSPARSVLSRWKSQMFLLLLTICLCVPVDGAKSCSLSAIDAANTKLYKKLQRSDVVVEAVVNVVPDQSELGLFNVTRSKIYKGKKHLRVKVDGKKKMLKLLTIGQLASKEEFGDACIKAISSAKRKKQKYFFFLQKRSKQGVYLMNELPVKRNKKSKKAVKKMFPDGKLIISGNYYCFNTS